MKREYVEFIGEISTLSIDPEAKVMYILQGNRIVPFDLEKLTEEEVIELIETLSFLIKDIKYEDKEPEIMEIPKPPEAEKKKKSAKDIVKKVLKGK